MIALSNISMIRIKRRGESGQPCLTPLPSGILAGGAPLKVVKAVRSVRRYLMALIVQ